MEQSRKEVVVRGRADESSRAGTVPAGLLGAERKSAWLEEVSKVGSRLS